MECVSSICRSFSDGTFHLGPVGAGQAFKLIHNTLLALVAVANAEALTVAEKLGLDLSHTLEILSTSSTRSFALDWLFRPAIRGDFSGGAKIDILRKDMKLALDQGGSVGATMEFAKIATRIFDECSAEGLGECDVSVTMDWMRRATST